MRYRLPATLVHFLDDLVHAWPAGGLARRCMVLPLHGPCGSEAVLYHDTA